ncbi:uncharacterized protein [Salvelinus alpinus]|uniref:uncharacterized protein isoform X1 n=1 Tax=Salvelinus alpinus TaxID=8036 RepID=UPI0039FBF847
MSLLLCWAVMALHLATGLDAASGVVNTTEEEVEGVDSQSPCPAGWHQNEHRCFSFYPVLATWATAELYCSQHRGNLVSVHSPGQHVFVQDLVRRHTDQPVWIGGYDAAQEGMWLWSDGSAVDGFNWEEEEPSNSGQGENCMELHTGGGRGWNDVSCGELRFYVCSMETRSGLAVMPSQKQAHERVLGGRLWQLRTGGRLWQLRTGGRLWQLRTGDRRWRLRTEGRHCGGETNRRLRAMDHHWRLCAMDHHWRLRAMDHHWRLCALDHHWSGETHRRPGSGRRHRTHQAGETCRRVRDLHRHRTHQAGETGSRPLPWPRHRIHWAVEAHWRSRAKSLHNPSWLDGDFGPARTGRRHRTHWAVQTHWRHSVQSRRRISWAVETSWRSGVQGWHTPSWLDAHSSPADARSWDIAHRAKNTYWRHRSLHCITRCLISTTPATVSTGSWLRSPT